MRKKLVRKLQSQCSQFRIVRIYRKYQAYPDTCLRGFVVDMNDRLVLLQKLDSDTMSLNGFTVIRVTHIRRWDFEFHFAMRALQLKGFSPSTPIGQISLSDIGSVLLSASTAYPLVMIERERIEPRFAFIGVVEKLTQKSLVLKKLDPGAVWIDSETFGLKGITQVTFGDGYTLALAMVNADNR
jgi:hypothetical protein